MCDHWCVECVLVKGADYLDLGTEEWILKCTDKVNLGNGPKQVSD